MALSKKLKNPFVQQYLIEIVFPLVGYFFFDWDILIIGVYYLIDHLSSQLLFFRRALWVNNKGAQQYGIHFLLGSIVAFVLLFFIEVTALGYFIIETQNTDLTNVLDSFFIFFKQELWFLFPIVIFVYHFKDQFTFYMPRHYLKYNFKRLIFWDIITNATILLLFCLGGYLWTLFEIHNSVVIFVFVAFKIGFDLTIKQFTKNKTLLSVEN